MVAGLTGLHVAIAGGAAAGYCLANVGQDAVAHEHVFTRFLDGTAGNIMAGAIIFSVALGLTLMVAAVSPLKNHLGWSIIMSCIMFLGSGCVMTGLNLIPTVGVENLGESLTQAFDLTQLHDLPADKFVQSPQFLLVAGCSMMGLVFLVGLIYGSVKLIMKCKSKAAGGAIQNAQPLHVPAGIL